MLQRSAKECDRRCLGQRKFIRGIYVEAPALTPIVFTSNGHAPKDHGLVKRLLILSYTLWREDPYGASWKYQ